MLESRGGLPNRQTAKRPNLAGSVLEKGLAALRECGRPALIPYFMAGYPSVASSREAILRAVEAGADVVEIGAPFSDPLADGPSIQYASHQALAGGMDLAGALKIAESCAARMTAPRVLMTYMNVLMAGGFERSLARVRAAGVSGLIVPDLSLEAGREFAPAVDESGLDLIQLAAPTTPAARLGALARASRGFLYLVSVTGVTGARAALPADIRAFAARARAATRLPLCVGFGISTPEQAATLARAADGVVIGSALVNLLRTEGPGKGPRAVAAFLGRVRAALDRTRE
ncbi:MAG: tryptophan synthase subunit alpha [Planctomycetes bacterium]|nr:tryptophan synthase subunit alpha [Planctomycetota bacterium]